MFKSVTDGGVTFGNSRYSKTDPKRRNVWEDIGRPCDVTLIPGARADEARQDQKKLVEWASEGINGLELIQRLWAFRFARGTKNNPAAHYVAYAINTGILAAK
jgi:hypothetical protein